jgi:hypothetical protein
MTDENDQDALREGLKRVAVALKDDGRPFALTGGYAAWVHGAPESGHDVDFLVRPEDASGLAARLAEQGFEVSQPPEDWLFKVHTDGVVVDLLHRTSGTSPEAALGNAVEVPVLSVAMPVVAATDLVGEKLLALDEHYCDLAALLPTLRAVREKVDWSDVRRRVEGQPFAEATLFLLERLAVIAGG